MHHFRFKAFHLSYRSNDIEGFSTSLSPFDVSTIRRNEFFFLSFFFFHCFLWYLVRWLPLYRSWLFFFLFLLGCGWKILFKSLFPFYSKSFSTRIISWWNLFRFIYLILCMYATWFQFLFHISHSDPVLRHHFDLKIAIEFPAMQSRKLRKDG